MSHRPTPPVLVAALLALACGEEVPAFTRVAGWSPSGEAVPVGATASIDLSAPVSPEGILDGRRVALATAPEVKAATAAIESTVGLTAATPVVPCEVALSPDRRRITLRPRAPLTAGLAHTLLLGPLQDAEGRPVLDAEGRRRAFAATFRTARSSGPPPRPVLTEALAAAAPPQAGGEYVEVQDRGEGALDLEGWRLEKRTPSTAWSGCDLHVVSGGPAPAGGFALLTGDAWDGRYGTPAGVPRATCGTAALLGGLADDRPLELRLLDPDGAVRATLGALGAAPRCGGALALVDPEGSDVAANLACQAGTGTPGTCDELIAPAGCR